MFHMLSCSSRASVRAARGLVGCQTSKGSRAGPGERPQAGRAAGAEPQALSRHLTPQPACYTQPGNQQTRGALRVRNTVTSYNFPTIPPLISSSCCSPRCPHPTPVLTPSQLTPVLCFLSPRPPGTWHGDPGVLHGLSGSARLWNQLQSQQRGEHPRPRRAPARPTDHSPEQSRQQPHRNRYPWLPSPLLRLPGAGSNHRGRHARLTPRFLPARGLARGWCAARLPPRAACSFSRVL